MFLLDLSSYFEAVASRCNVLNAGKGPGAKLPGPPGVIAGGVGAWPRTPPATLAGSAAAQDGGVLAAPLRCGERQGWGLEVAQASSLDQRSRQEPDPGPGPRSQRRAPSRDTMLPPRGGPGSAASAKVPRSPVAPVGAPRLGATVRPRGWTPHDGVLRGHGLCCSSAARPTAG